LKSKSKSRLKGREQLKCGDYIVHGPVYNGDNKTSTNGIDYFDTTFIVIQELTPKLWLL
jgi:hypothetical protein